MSAADATDLDYLRQVSARGAEAPLMGGRDMAWWGGLVMIAYLAHYLAIRGLIERGDGVVFPLVWIAFSIVGGIGQSVLSRGRIARAGSSSAGNRASRTAWFAAVAAILSFIAGAIVRSLDSNYAAFDASVPVVFAAYAMALAVSGWLAPAPVARVAAVAAFVMVAITAALAGSSELWLAAAIGAFVSVFVPGLLLVRAEPPRGG